LKKITLKMDASSGTGQLIDSGEIIRGDILDKPFASGTVKHAYDVCPVHVKFRAHPNFDVPQLYLSNGDQFVAKRFFKVEEHGEEQVPLETNQAEITLKYSNSARGGGFWRRFTDFAKLPTTKFLYSKASCSMNTLFGSDPHLLP
jgi:hypothetical protein